MGKPRWLKTSYIKEKLYQLFLSDIAMTSQKSCAGKEKNLLIVVGDCGLGDAVVFSVIVKEIVEQYKAGKIYVVVEDKWAKFYQDYCYCDYQFNYGNNIKKRVKINRLMFKKVNQLKINQVVFFGGYNKLHRYIRYNHAYCGLVGRRVELDSKTTKYLNSNSEDRIRMFDGNRIELRDGWSHLSVLDELREYLIAILHDEKYLQFQFKLNYKMKNPEYKKSIVCAIGASDMERVFSLNKMHEVIGMVLEMFGNSQIILVGSGAVQKAFSEKIVELIGTKKRVINMCDQLNLTEAFTLINSCELFLGFDSGLYNVAAMFGTKTLGFFGSISGFEHFELENVDTVLSKHDKTASTNKIDGISKDAIRKSLIKLNMK